MCKNVKRRDSLLMWRALSFSDREGGKVSVSSVQVGAGQTIAVRSDTMVASGEKCVRWVILSRNTSHDWLVCVCVCVCECVTIWCHLR